MKCVAILTGHWLCANVPPVPRFWFPGSRPISFREIEWSTLRFHLALAKEKVLKSPGIDARHPGQGVAGARSGAAGRDEPRRRRYPSGGNHAGCLWLTS